LLAKNVNDNARCLIPRRALRFFASKFDPAKERLEHILLSDVIATLAVASLLAQFSDIVPEDPRLHVIDLIQSLHAPPLGAG
jgi:hypothetical protein